LSWSTAAGYAGTFLAETVPAAVDQLKEAIRHDPFHRSGPQMLATLLFLSGRVAEMREVLAAIRATRPESTAIYQMDVFLAGLDRDRAALDRAVLKLARVSGGGGEKALRAIAELIMIAQDEWFHVNGIPPDRYAGLVKDYLTIGPEIGRMMGDPDPDGRSVADMAFFRLPLFRAMGEMPVFKGIGSNPLGALALTQPEKMAELFEGIVRVCPEGSFLLLYGGTLERVGKLAEAEAAFRRAVDAPAWSNHRRAGLFRLMNAQNGLAYRAKDYAGYADWKRKAAANARLLATSGPGLPEVVASATASTLADDGDTTLALAVTEASVAANPDQIGPRLRKASFEYQLGLLERAEATARDVLARKSPISGVDRFALNTLLGVATSYRSAGRWPDAERVYRLVVDKRRAVLGTDDPDTLAAMEQFADGYFAAGRPDLGLPLAREAVAGHRRRLSGKPVELATTLALAGSNLLRQGQPKAAEPILRECLALREKHLRPTNWAVANARSMLGAALAGQKRYEEAEPLLVAGYDGMTAPWAELIPPARGNVELAAQRLVDLYTAWGKPEEAAKWREKLPREVAPPPRRQGLSKVGFLGGRGSRRAEGLGSAGASPSQKSRFAAIFERPWPRRGRRLTKPRRWGTNYLSNA
jgi:tetratricopeptide (TPR) repeat protein